MEKSAKPMKTPDVRQLAPEEIDEVGGGRGGYTNNGDYVVCGSVVLINGTIYIGGINGPIAMTPRF